MRRIGVLESVSARMIPTLWRDIAAFLQGAAAIGLDRRPQRARSNIGGPKAMLPTCAELRSRIGRARAVTSSCPLAVRVPGAVAAKATRTVPIVFSDRSRSGRCRLRR